MIFQVCLTATGKPRKIISINPDDNVKDLYDIARKTFDQECIDLKSGFPPKSLEPSSVKIQAILSNNDRIAVIINEEKRTGNDRVKNLPAQRAVQTSSASTTELSTGRRSKRAAAKAATEAFADVIHAQDKMMKEQQKPSRKRLNVSPSKRKPSTSRKLAKLPGRRLRDGADMQSSDLQKVRKGKFPGTFRNRDDVSFALLNALENSGGGKVGQVLRSAMRNAVSRQYDASRAMTRVSAVQAGKYSIDETSASLNTNSSTTNQLRIKFDKMMEGRGEFEEVVDFIPRDALEAVIKAIHGSDPESLRAATLSQLSPRVFWSVLQETANSPNCIEGALLELLPGLDWGFLRSRKKTLSEKAKENLRQEQLDDGADEHDLERAAEAVQAVEKAMEQLHDHDKTQRRNRFAHAALERQTNHFSWTHVTPADTDEQELMACTGGDFDMAQKLLLLGIHNWRELANVEDVRSLSTQLEKVDAPTVEAWIDHARAESLEEIIVEICDNCVEAVFCLREEARTGTPKDLANWRSMPEILFESAPSLKKINKEITVEMILSWCIRSQAILEKHEWLNWYATPVD